MIIYELLDNREVYYGESQGFYSTKELAEEYIALQLNDPNEPCEPAPFATSYFTIKEVEIDKSVGASWQTVYRVFAIFDPVTGAIEIIGKSEYKRIIFKDEKYEWFDKVLDVGIYGESSVSMDRAEEVARIYINEFLMPKRKPL